MRLLVAGGTGTAGRAVVQEAVQRGHDVRVLTIARADRRPHTATGRCSCGRPGHGRRAGRGAGRRRGGGRRQQHRHGLPPARRGVLHGRHHPPRGGRRPGGGAPPRRCSRSWGWTAHGSATTGPRSTRSGAWPRGRRRQEWGTRWPGPRSSTTSPCRPWSAPAGAGCWSCPGCGCSRSTSHEVAAHLVALAEGQPVGRAADLAGPRVERLPELVRRVAARRGAHVRVVGLPLPPGLRRSLLPGDGGLRGTGTFGQWLQTVPEGVSGR